MSATILLPRARELTGYPPGLNAGFMKQAINDLIADGTIRRERQAYFAFRKSMLPAGLSIDSSRRQDSRGG